MDNLICECALLSTGNRPLAEVAHAVLDETEIAENEDRETDEGPRPEAIAPCLRSASTDTGRRSR
jgi:hypothetical protein